MTDVDPFPLALEHCPRCGLGNVRVVTCTDGHDPIAACQNGRCRWSGPAADLTPPDTSADEAELAKILTFHYPT